MGRRGKLSEQELQIVHKKITDQEAYELFFKDCYLRNLRAATIEYYRNEFHGAVKILNKSLVDSNETDIQNFILKSKQLMKATTINTRLRALRAFYNFLVKNNHLKTNPMKNVKLLRDRQKNIETLDNKEIEMLLKVIRKQQSFVGFRDEVILLIFLDTGVRLSELIGIEVQDFVEDRIMIRKTKNLFERTVYLSEITRDQLKRYLKLRGSLETKKMFITQDEKDLKTHSVQTRFTKYGRTAEISKRVSPHTFRHTMARRMVVAGIDAFSLMTLLGHQDMAITKRYVNLWGPDIQKKHKEFGALRGLKL